MPYHVQLYTVDTYSLWPSLITSDIISHVWQLDMHLTRGQPSKVPTLFVVRDYTYTDFCKVPYFLRCGNSKFFQNQFSRPKNFDKLGHMKILAKKGRVLKRATSCWHPCPYQTPLFYWIMIKKLHCSLPSGLYYIIWLAIWSMAAGCPCKNPCRKGRHCLVIGLG